MHKGCTRKKVTKIPQTQARTLRVTFTHTWVSFLQVSSLQQLLSNSLYYWSKNQQPQSPLAHSNTTVGQLSEKWVLWLSFQPAIKQISPALYLTQTRFDKWRDKRPGPLESRGPSPNAQFPAASHYFVMSKCSRWTTGHPTVSRHQKTISLRPWTMKPEKILQPHIQVSRQYKNKHLCSCSQVPMKWSSCFAGAEFGLFQKNSL